jgi:cell division protein FtsN
MRGGTFLGLIFGLIAGLAVALAVAMYIAKIPIPFVNNVPLINNVQNAAEDQKNRNWNPNAGLQSHGPAQPASDAGNAPQPPSVTIPPPVEVGPSTLNKPPSPNPTAGNLPIQPPTPRGTQTGNGGDASGDVLGDFAAARTRGANDHANSANTASPAAADAPFIYLVQTGAFRAPEDADAERARLSLLGMQSAISEYDQAGRPVYRVRIGPFQNKAAADQIKDRLADNGFEAALVRVPR